MIREKHGQYCFFQTASRTTGQGRTEVGWRPGQETSLVPPRQQLRSFGSKSTVLKKVLATMLGLFGARGIVPPLSPRYAPATRCNAVVLYIIRLCTWNCNICTRLSVTFCVVAYDLPYEHEWMSSALSQNCRYKIKDASVKSKGKKLLVPRLKSTTMWIFTHITPWTSLTTTFTLAKAIIVKIMKSIKLACFLLRNKNCTLGKWNW